MKIFKLLIIVLLFVGISNKSFSQDTIHWRPDYKLKWEDFQGKPDTTVIALAVCASEITYQYKIVDGKLTYTIDCFFDKKKSWIKYNMAAITDHEQGHFDISKLFALKLEKRFRDYKITNVYSVYQDLQNMYNSIIQERTQMHNRYDKVESENPMTDIPQKNFVEDIRKQIATLQKQMGLK
jgi:hypothetical protein